MKLKRSSRFSQKKFKGKLVYIMFYSLIKTTACYI